jgi:dihydrofolate synthase/folylpolyglutamate synthase
MYDRALGYLNSLIDFEKLGAMYFGRDRFQLATVRTLLSAVDDPQQALRIVHIAGTKGKGSTAAILDSILRAAGLRVALFTQPHLVDIRERTLVDGRPISEAEFVSAVDRVRPHADRLNAQPNAEPVTFYEAHLVAALLAFAQREAQIAIIETGLGGRLDATNALQPEATAITRVDYDHTDILGDHLEAIAREKAGILKPGVPCIFAPQAPEVTAILEAQAAAVGAPVEPLPATTEHNGGLLDVRGRRTYEGLRLALRGRHQHENAALSVGLAELVDPSGACVTQEAVRSGLANVRWPGRFQVLESEPTLVLDVAHNPVSAQVLRRGLEDLRAQRPARGRLLLVVGIAKDKDVPGFVGMLAPIADCVVCTQAHSPRAATPEVVAEAARALGAEIVCRPTVADALREVRRVARPEDVVCVTGSFHVVGEAMQALGIDPLGAPEGGVRW